MRYRWVAILLAAAFFVLAFLILLQQKLTFGVWFQVHDALHHEAFALESVALGLGIIIGAIVGSSAQEEPDGNS